MARPASSPTPQIALPASGEPATSFEAALTELEALVQAMESSQNPQGDAMSLEQSLTAYQRGSELLKYCQRTLAQAEQRIAVLENGVVRNDDERSLVRPGN